MLTSLAANSAEWHAFDQMTAGAPYAAIGAHPLTGKLVSALRRAGGGLDFATEDLVRFIPEGKALGPDGLVLWVRELSTLAITLRNDVLASAAAARLERELIDPLCRVLEEQARPDPTRPRSVERLVEAERRRAGKGSAGEALPAESTVSSYLRRRRNTQKGP